MDIHYKIPMELNGFTSLHDISGQEIILFKIRLHKWESWFSTEKKKKTVVEV